MASLDRLFLSLTLLFTSLDIGSAQQYLLEPFPVQTAVGLSATIYCQVNTVYTDRKVYWALPNDEGAIGPNINTNENYNRHQFVGNPQHGFYNLQISKVTDNDEGSYSCIFTNDGSGPDDTFTLEAVAYLNVTKMDTQMDTVVSCDDTEVLEFQDGNFLPNFTCTAEGGVPLANSHALNWYMQLRNNSVINIPSITTVDPSGPGTVKATIISDQFPLSGHNDNSFLVCAAGPLESPNLQFCDTPNGASVIGSTDKRLRVVYEPLVRFLPSSIEVGMFEQFSLELKCSADSNPSLLGHPTFQFDDISEVGEIEFGNDSLVVGRLFSRVTLTITRADIGKYINCTATNGDGTTTVSIRVESLGGLPAWLICAIIFVGGFFLFIFLVVCLALCCRCDLEHERKGRERRRRTFRDSKVNGIHSLHDDDDDDDFRDLDLQAYDNPPAMMPDSPNDSGNYAESEEGSDALVNDFKIEEPDGAPHHVQITSDQEFDDDDDEDPPKARPDYLQVTIADDTAGEEMELDELSRDRSPSLNEL